ncbi:MAG: zinc-ribbon domain-containing protein [Alphaproteobacteria bacterium]|nr:zinc-ribbon domain-containing protein [Alphaproteobacteria bacterium]
MLISCPKCHSIYEVPDNLIPPSGQKFRCQACANVWHALKSDALGYEEENSGDDKPYVEAIEVSEPPYRNYPSDKNPYTVVQENKSGKKTISSKELVKEEGDPDFVAPKPKKKKELTLTSDFGTSFTISMDEKDNKEDDRKAPRLFLDDNEGIKADTTDRLVVEKKKCWFVKTKIFLWLLIVCCMLYLLRAGVVHVYGGAEEYYNKLGLSGYDNQENLEFVDVSISGNEDVVINASIVNNGMFATKVPGVKVDGRNEVFEPKQSFLKAKEKTFVEIKIDGVKGINSSYNIKFVR